MACSNACQSEAKCQEYVFSTSSLPQDACTLVEGSCTQSPKSGSNVYKKATCCLFYCDKTVSITRDATSGWQQTHLNVNPTRGWEQIPIPDFSYGPTSCGFSKYEIAAATHDGGAAPTVRISTDGKHVEYSSASEGTHNFNLVVFAEGGATRSYASQITVNGCSKVQITNSAAPAGWVTNRFDIDASRGQAPDYMKVIPIPDFQYSDPVCGYKNYFITGASKEAVILNLEAKTLAYSAAVDKVFSFNLNVRAIGEESVSFPTTITVEKCPTNNVISIPATGGYQAQVDYDVSA